MGRLVSMSRTRALGGVMMRNREIGPFDNARNMFLLLGAITISMTAIAFIAHILQLDLLDLSGPHAWLLLPSIGAAMFTYVALSVGIYGVLLWAFGERKIQ